MSIVTKNKLLTWLVLLLLMANAATLAVFWLGKNKKQNRPTPVGPKEFLIKELSLTEAQQATFTNLAETHRKSVEGLRQQLKTAKENIFLLVQNDGATDSMKQAAAAAASRITEQIDMLTINHFQQLRAMLSSEQKQKFDKMLKDLPGMLAAHPPPSRRDGIQGPHPGEHMPPPPERQIPASEKK